MSVNPRRNVQQFRLNLRSADLPPSSLHALSTFLFDFSLFYEISRLATDPKYVTAPLPRQVRYRRPSHLSTADQLRIERLRVESPVNLLATIPATEGAGTALFAVWSGIVALLSTLPPGVYYTGAAIVALKALAKGGKTVAEAIKVLAEAGKIAADGAKTLAEVGQAQAEAEKARAEARKLLAEVAKMDMETVRASTDAEIPAATLEEPRTMALTVPAEPPAKLTRTQQRSVIAQIYALQERINSKLVQGLDTAEFAEQEGLMTRQGGDLQVSLEDLLALLEARGATATYGQALQRLVTSSMPISRVTITIERDMQGN